MTDASAQNPAQNPAQTEIASFEELDKAALVQNGRRKVLFGLSTCLFFEDGHTEPPRQASLDVLAGYLEAHRDTVNCWYPIGGRGMRPMGDKDPIALYRAHAATAPPTQKSGGEIAAFARPKDSGEATHHLARTLWMDQWARWSNVVMTRPASGLSAGTAPDFVRQTLHWCSLLRPGHGTAGLSFIPDFGFGLSAQSTLAWPMIARHPGFDWPDVGTWCVRASKDPQRSIRTVGWLTILDDAFVERLGGRAALEAKLTADCLIHDWDGGILIQAGPMPRAGDVNAGDVPAPYRAVSQAVDPLIFASFKPKHGLFTPPKPLVEGVASAEWVRRFS